MDGEEAAGREDGGGRDRGVAESGKGGRGGSGGGWASEVRRMFTTEREKKMHTHPPRRDWS